MADRLQLLRELTAGVVREARRYRTAADGALADLGLSYASAIPVLVLSRLGDDVRQGALARDVGVEGPSLVRLVDLLVEAGLVRRKDDPDDRRARRLVLTPQGRRVATQAEAALDKLRAQLLAEVSDADLAASVAAFAALTRVLDGPAKGEPA